MESRRRRALREPPADWWRTLLGKSLPVFRGKTIRAPDAGTAYWP
ncbi:MAG: hypothetical protein M0Z41_03555 [Peptococcaceae bacterium]|nr:hypothetical protein [Peptococcaceae bacterium]